MAPARREHKVGALETIVLGEGDNGEMQHWITRLSNPTSSDRLYRARRIRTVARLQMMRGYVFAAGKQGVRLEISARGTCSG